MKYGRARQSPPLSREPLAEATLRPPPSGLCRPRERCCQEILRAGQCDWGGRHGVARRRQPPARIGSHGHRGPCIENQTIAPIHRRLSIWGAVGGTHPAPPSKVEVILWPSSDGFLLPSPLWRCCKPAHLPNRA